LRQVLTNLIGNAIKFTARGEVVVSVAEATRTKSEKADDTDVGVWFGPQAGAGCPSAAVPLAADEVLLTFAVEDTGIGIAAEEQERIFSPFTQVDASMTRNYGGTGLGLAIAANLVTLMGGRIGVKSQLGRGSVFAFTVRLKRQTGAATDQEADLAKRERLQGLPTLLVAENPTVRRILQMMLFRWGMRPDTMSDVPAALVKLHEAAASGQAYPVALVDASLSKIDGYTMASWIKNNPGLVGTTVLMFSPCDRVSHVRRCQELGIRFLEKPIFQAHLLDLISQAIDIADPPPSSAESLPDTGPAKAMRARRVLIVEDNAANQQLALHILKKCGHSAAVAANGVEAVERVCNDDFDLVLMDVQMPLMDGYQATAAIRALADPAKARVPIIAMTAHAMASHHRRCLAAGMDGYLDKPIKADKLIEIVENWGNATREAFFAEPKLVSPSTTAEPDCVFNLQEALARCFDREMFDQMREYFVTQSAEMLDRIRVALESGGAEEIARAAHALRGTLVYLGSPSCVEAAARVERMGESGDLSAAVEPIERLTVQIELLKRALAASEEKKEQSTP
jgi:two-component system, sensor histidine kinase and response regulator